MAVIIAPQIRHKQKTDEQIRLEQEAIHKANIKRKEVILIVDSEFCSKSSMTTEEALIIKEWILADAKAYCVNNRVLTNQPVVSASIQQREKAAEQQTLKEQADARAFGFFALCIVGFFIGGFLLSCMWNGFKNFMGWN